MNLLIDNNDALGQQDYTACVDVDHLPKIARRLNRAATMTACLVAADPSFHPPVSGARVLLQRADGFRLFTGYLATAPEQQYLGYSQAGAAWRYTLQALDDSCLLDHNALPVRTPFAFRTAGDAVRTLANDVLPNGLDLSGVQDVSPVNQFLIVPQKTWTEHVQELATMTRASYRAHDGKLYFEEVGQQSFTISEQDQHFVPEGLVLLQSDQLRNDVTIIGEFEPLVYVRDYFLGDGTTLGFYLSDTPFSKTAVTIFEEDYTATSLEPTLWSVTDPNGRVSVSGGQLQISGGPATVTFVEQLELAGGLMMQHGQVVFNAASSGTFGALYNGSVGDANCIAGFSISPNGANCSIQALINGAWVGSPLATVPGHLYSFTSQLFCNEAHRIHQTYLSSTHPAGNGRGGDSVSAAMRVVLAVHDVDPNNPGTLVAPATVLYDDVLPAPPGFATYALANGPNLCVSVSFTRLQHVVDTEVRSLIPGGQFRTRLTGNFADGGECYVTSSAELRFYPPYPPQINEQVVVAYRSSARAMARVQDQNSIAAHHNGSDSGRRSYVRRLKLPLAPTSIDCENAAVALLDDTVQPAWAGEYRVISDFLPVGDVIPTNAVQISAPSRGAAFMAIVREVDLQVISLRDDRSEYLLHFSNDAAELLAFKFETMILPEPLTAVFTTTVPSSSLYLPALTAAQVTNVIATEITVDAGIVPPPGGGIEVRRSDGGWGTGSDGNLAGRFTTQTFNLPRLSRVQGYYLRQYDASSPAKYSRDSALLYVDYPL
ncbi:MAG TPA: hypothetical protein VFC29_19715 [Candidatus Limnocylindrales bacterium]|nr:hypothetical protein [Candidatus Limnocylindrales bacterium]